MSDDAYTCACYLRKLVTFKSGDILSWQSLGSRIYKQRTSARCNETQVL